ncbi:MAG: kynureninase [Saprospiraceae bacterium]|nr:kynureninase [Saprospiraceae bacterium]
MNTSLTYALELDHQDELSSFRQRFHIPKDENGNDVVYLCGNSLGLMPKATSDYINQELEDWKNLGVEGHFLAKNPWMPYHEFLTKNMANVVGALPSEVVVMNSLTVNLHLLMVSFYRPTSNRYKILFDYSPFPSDRYAIASQVKFHGYDPADAMIELIPDSSDELVSIDNIKNILETQGNEIALILIGGVNYYTGQLYDIKTITQLGHAHGCVVGFDLAHAAGNIDLHLHEDGPDFAAWCSYKYLNSGPGSLSGCFVHERHHQSDLPRFAGWWGHDKATRFLMGDEFQPIQTAEGWQLSNPPVLSMAAIRASLDLFAEAGIDRLRSKSVKLTAYLADLLAEIQDENIKIITPSDPSSRGCQLSIQMIKPDKKLFNYLTENGVIADWREPDVIRVAPVPMYNSFEDVWQFCRILKDGLSHLKA